MTEDARTESDTPKTDDSPDRVKRAYVRPRLTVFGSVAKLTQGTLTQGSDGPGGGFRMNCL